MVYRGYAKELNHLAKKYISLNFIKKRSVFNNMILGVESVVTEDYNTSC